ncbi:hypothetical protein MTO96_024678 [Rhipicephalus appendiculatus]
MQNHQGRMYCRDDQEGRPPPHGQPPTPYVIVVAALPAADAVVEESTPPTRPATSRPPTCVPITIPLGHLARRPQLDQPGEPAASPRGRSHRDVATWTSQDGVGPPVAYVSARPWRRQERARMGTPPARLYRLFQGRTVEDADRRANGACLPVPAGTRLCECGAVVVHSSHELGKLHRRRTEVTVPPSRETSQDPPQRRGQGHDVAGSLGGGFRPVAPDSGLRPCGRRESARTAATHGASIEELKGKQRVEGERRFELQIQLGEAREREEATANLVEKMEDDLREERD